MIRVNRVLIILLGLSIFMFAESGATKEDKKEIKCGDKLLIGQAEWVYLPSIKVKMRARKTQGLQLHL